MGYGVGRRLHVALRTIAGGVLTIGGTPFVTVADATEPIERDVRSGGAAYIVHTTVAPVYRAGMEPLASVGAEAGCAGAD